MTLTEVDACEKIRNERNILVENGEAKTTWWFQA
jgi:hypothetical protein